MSNSTPNILYQIINTSQLLNRIENFNPLRGKGFPTKIFSNYVISFYLTGFTYNLQSRLKSKLKCVKCENQTDAMIYPGFLFHAMIPGHFRTFQMCANIYHLKCHVSSTKPSQAKYRLSAKKGISLSVFSFIEGFDVRNSNQVLQPERETVSSSLSEADVGRIMELT